VNDVTYNDVYNDRWRSWMIIISVAMRMLLPVSYDTSDPRGLTSNAFLSLFFFSFPFFFLLLIESKRSYVVYFFFFFS